jgi:hypothetical protein
MTNAPTLSRSALERALQRSFVEGVVWPIDQASLAALADMGLSVEQIADCFAVDSQEVRGRLAGLPPVRRQDGKPAARQRRELV